MASSGSVNTAIPGTYILTYSHTDTSSNIGSVSRTVQVIPSVVTGSGIVFTGSIVVLSGSTASGVVLNP